MKKKRLVPKRRFEGFNDNWTETTLKEFRDERDRYSFTGGPFGSDLKSEDYTKSGVRIIQLQNIGDGYFSNQYKIFTSEQKAKSLSTNLIYPNEIIIAKMAEPLARAAIIPDNDTKYLMSSDGIRLKVDIEKFHTYFILTLINSDIFRRKAIENSTGTTRRRIGLVTLGNLMSNIPKYKEQQRIGEFFKHLNEMITLQQRKIDKTKALKSAYLAEMFPAEGERIPKRRFEGYIDNWEKHKLEDLAEIRTGKAFRSTDFLKNGKYLVVTNKNIQDQTNGIETGGDRINISDEAVLNNYLLCGDNILVTMDGVNIGKVGKYSDNKGVLAQRVGRINSEQLEFVYQITRNIKFVSEMDRLSVGNAIKHISLKQIADYSFMAPKSNIEQQKIGAFFKQLDNKVTNHQRKLDKLNATKQAYLHEMFV